jgi:hypothetical protein
VDLSNDRPFGRTPSRKRLGVRGLRSGVVGVVVTCPWCGSGVIPVGGFLGSLGRELVALDLGEVVGRWPLAAGLGDGVTIPAVAVMVVAGDGGCRIDDGGYARPSSNCQQIVDFDLAVGSVCFVVHFGAGASDWISPNSGPSMPPYSR